VRYTGKIPIPDLTKGMEMIPQAILARNKQAQAARKLQAEGIKAANKQYAEALGEVGGINQNVHPFAVPLVQEAYDHFRNVRVPQLLAQSPATAKAQIAMEFQNFSNSVDKYLTNSDMMTAYAQYSDYMLGPGNELFDAKQKTLAADRRLNPTLEEFNSKRDYQMKGLMSGAHNVYNPDGSFSIMGLEIDPKTGQPRADMEIDLRTATHFNDANWFTPSTVRMAPRDYMDIAKDIHASYSNREHPFDWGRISSDLMGHWQTPMSFDAVNRESEAYEFRLAAAEQAIPKMRDPQSNYYTPTAVAMDDQALLEMFSLDPEVTKGYPVLASNVQNALTMEWNNEFRPLVEYLDEDGGGSGPRLEDLMDGAAPFTMNIQEFNPGDISLLPNIPAALASPGPDKTSEQVLQSTDEYDDLNVELRSVNLRSTNDYPNVVANMFNASYYDDVKFLEGSNIITKDINTGAWVASNPETLPLGIAELLTKANQQYEAVTIHSIAFTEDPNKYVVIAEDNRVVVVDKNNLNFATQDLHTSIRQSLAMNNTEVENPIEELRRRVVTKFPFGTGSSVQSYQEWRDSQPAGASTTYQDYLRATGQ
jgi:hypothetical protein